MPRGITFRTPVSHRTSADVDQRYTGGRLAFNIAYPDPRTGEIILHEGMTFADTESPATFLARLKIPLEKAVITPRRR